MGAIHQRTGKKVRLSHSHQLFAQERKTVDEAFAGDILGIVGLGDYEIGDTLTTDPAIRFDEIPRFPAEKLAYLHNPNTSNYKRFRAGLDQLLQEKVVQRFTLNDAPHAAPLLGAVGTLQFDVVQARLEGEYGAESRIELTPYTVVRWYAAGSEIPDWKVVHLPYGTARGNDADGAPVLLFHDKWPLQTFQDKFTKVILSEYPTTVRP